MHDAKTHLSRYVARLRDGDTIVLCRRNVPVAEIRPLASGRGEIATPGRWKGLITIPPEFFQPLPDDLLDAFDGPTGDPASPDAR